MNDSSRRGFFSQILAGIIAFVGYTFFPFIKIKNNYDAFTLPNHTKIPNKHIIGPIYKVKMPLTQKDYLDCFYNRGIISKDIYQKCLIELDLNANWNKHTESIVLKHWEKEINA